MTFFFLTFIRVGWTSYVCHHAHSYVMGAEYVRIPSDSKIERKEKLSVFFI